MTDIRKEYSRAAKLVVSLGAFFIFLLLAEILLSFAKIESTNDNPFFPINRDINFPEVYKLDSELFWKFRENSEISSAQYSKISYRINSLGLRGKEIVNKESDLRILALGNSCTFGWGIIEEQIWVLRLEEMLNDSMPESIIEVINGGIPGYTTFQGSRLYKNELSQIMPQFVLIMYGWNDHWPAGKDIPDKNQKSPPEIILKLRNLLGQLSTYRAIRKLVLKFTDNSPRIAIDDLRFKKRVSKSDFVSNLNEIIKTAIERNCTPILIVPPLPRFSTTEMKRAGNLVIQHREYQELIRSTAESLNVQLVDLQADFYKYDGLFDDHMFDPIHFNEKGHYLIALKTASILLPYLKDEQENGN